MRKIVFAVILLSLVVGLYGYFIEPRWVRCKSVTIRNSIMAETFKGLKIVHISDLHVGKSWPPAVVRALGIMRDIKPDMIFLTGDYVPWNRSRKDYDASIAFLSNLEAPLGVFGVLGDSDYFFSRKSCEFCHDESGFLPTTKHRVKFLPNEVVSVEQGRRSWFVAGVDEYYDAGEKVSGVIERLNTRLPTILLSHSSMIYHDIDPFMNVLVLSGDTHGGQIRLPGFIWKFFKRKEDPDHIYGLYREKRKSLYVTSGLGLSSFPFRLGRRPEIVIFEFEKEGLDEAS